MTPLEGCDRTVHARGGKKAAIAAAAAASEAEDENVDREVDDESERREMRCR